MKPSVLSLLALLLFQHTGEAAIAAHYDFTDADLLDNEFPMYGLNEVTTGTGSVTINPDGSASFPGNDSGNTAYLASTGPGGTANFTVSLWVRTQNWDQGGYQGIFSNNSGPTTPFSWQIDVHNGNLRVVSATGGFSVISTDATGFATDTWHHIVLRKSTDGMGAITTELFATALGASGPNSLGTNDDNPGGLQNFRLGSNRNTDSLFEMDLANVKIYDDAEVSITDLFNEGPMTIPEPSSLLLCLTGLLSLFLRDRKINEA